MSFSHFRKKLYKVEVFDWDFWGHWSKSEKNSEIKLDFLLKKTQSFKKQREKWENLLYPEFRIGCLHY